MKSIENIPYVEVPDLEACGYTRSFIDKSTSIGSSTLPYIKIKGCKLFPFNNLGKRYKESILKQFGEPLEYLRKAPIIAKVQKDLKAEQFFLSQTKDGLYTFSDEKIKKSAEAAGWLNMLVKYWSKKAAKEEFDMPVDTFIVNVLSLIKANKIDLPASRKRLKKKLDAYHQEGYNIFIHGHTGKTSNAAKITDERSEAQLLSLVEHPNQHDDVMVCFLYNIWAKENGYKELESPATVGNWRRKKEPEITIGRNGNSKMNEKYIRQVKGFKPTAPCMLWESDDNNLDFYYNNPDPQKANDVYNRYVAYVVVDSYCGLVLGKSYYLAKSPKIEMVRHAYIDAMYYVRSLTGGWYLPFEVKTDHWQKSAVFPFLEKIGKFVPPAHGNKHRGYIEQIFGSHHFKRCQKIGTNNYNGNNVTAASPGVNTEALKLNEKNRPLIGIEAENQIERFFNLLRVMPDISRNEPNAISKERQWLNKWETLTNEQKRPISDERFLMIFGIKHEPQGRAITITNRGVEPQINGIKYSYDLPDYVKMMELIGKKVNVIYDPYDMNRVLVTNGDDVRFIANSAVKQPRALEDAYPDCRHTLNMILSDKKAQVESVVGKATYRRSIIASEYDPESIVLQQHMRKELRNNVEHQYNSQEQANSQEDWLKKQMEYMNTKVNMGPYLNFDEPAVEYDPLDQM